MKGPERVSWPILYHFQDKAKYRSKIIPPAFDIPITESLSEYCHNVWYGNVRMVWLADGTKSLMIYLAVSTQYWGVTNGRTDRQTDICISIVRTMHSIAR